MTCIKVIYDGPTWHEFIEARLLVDVTDEARKVGFIHTTYFSSALYDMFRADVPTILKLAKDKIVRTKDESDKMSLFYNNTDMIVVLAAKYDPEPRITFMLLSEY